MVARGLGKCMHECPASRPRLHVFRSTAAGKPVANLLGANKISPHRLLRKDCLIEWRSMFACKKGVQPYCRSCSAATSSGNGALDQQPAQGYIQPPQEILDIIDRPPQPALSFSPDRKKVLQMYRPPPYPPIQELARPELKLAGMRIDTDLNAGSRMGHTLEHTWRFQAHALVVIRAKAEAMAVVDFTEDLVLPAQSERETRVSGFPAGSWLNFISWSDDARHIAFTVRSPGGPSDPPRIPMELWVADVATGEARRLLTSPQQGLNCVFDNYCWVDDDTIIANVVPEGRGPAPERPLAPLGPSIQDNSDGRTSQARTYPDLLKDTHDEELFEYYTTSSLLSIQVSTGEVKQIGGPRMYTAVDPSPDAQYLLVSWLERPFSFNVPCGRFPRRTQLWDRSGGLLHEVVALPLAEDIPITFNSCRKGPRSLQWRDDQPAELCWIEAQDGGDAKVAASPRDIVFTLPAADAGRRPPTVLATTDLRCGGLAWGNGDLALLYESWYDTRRSVVWTMAPDRPEDGKKVLFDRNYEDSYSDPGSPVTRRTQYGTYVLVQLDGQQKLLLEGRGASPEGNRPFVDTLDLVTGEKQRLWQSQPPFFESIGTLLNDLDFTQPIRSDNLVMLLTRETVRDQPQYHIRTLSAGSNGAVPAPERLLSSFPHPYPSIRDLQREVIRYKREDGIDLTATLYLPPGYDKDRDGSLPCLLWAYPREFKSKDAAGQMRRSPFQFSGMGGSSPQLFLALGFAVLDGPTLPIVAEGEEEPNDSYVQQLTAGARAAVEEVVSRGVVDRSRVACGGHSYGAFMAANLLAHAGDLFACGIAQSGAYNRTLTPFGFQSEQRTLWEAPDTYITMSPFLQADKIRKPLLLVHGADDNNTGTFPMQSERLYSALKGHGAITRLVILPRESHGYRARESILHVLGEQHAWLSRFCSSGSRKEHVGKEEAATPKTEQLSKL